MMTMQNRSTWLALIVAVAVSAFNAGCGDDPLRQGMPGTELVTDTGGQSFGDISFTGSDSITIPDTSAADTALVDTGAPDTGAPDTSAPDTSAPDTSAPDTSAPDTTTPDTTTPDTTTPDTTTPDTSAPDTSTPDTSAPDTSAPDTMQSDVGGSDGGVVAGPNSCAGRCGKYDGKASCQCDSYCAKAGDCCKDIATVCGCVGKSCCKTAADCDDKLSCTVDVCTSKGNCTHTAKAGFCAIDGKCRKAGEQGGSVCAVCEPKKSTKQWTLKAAGTACDDGQVCSTGDTCDTKGNCTGKPKSGCCTSDAACSTSTACQKASCDLKTGKCAFTPEPNCCTSGVCCDVANGKISAKATPCGTKTAKVEYRCEGAQVQKREALAGCDGSSATSCSTASANLAWGGWVTIQSCASGQVCQLTGADKAPICATPGTKCTKASECDDSNPCTTDSCVNNACTNQTKAGCCVFASDCNDGNACTIDTCTKNVCGHTAKTCAAPSTCESGVCDSKTGACGGKIKATSCKIDNACYASGAAQAADPCHICDPTKSQTSWTLKAACQCSAGVCCDVKAGRIKKKAEQCDEAVQASEYSCSKDGSQMLVRSARRGCTGKSNTCSVSKSNWHWSGWAPSLTCAKGTTCEVKDKTKAGACVSTVTLPTCNPNVTNACCTAKGTVAPKATPCDTPVVKSEQRCSSTAPGGKVQLRVAVAGCTGTSDTCSSAEAYLAWGDWKTKLQCGAGEVCKLTSTSSGPVGSCVTAQLCDPKAACCSSAGVPLKSGTACGSPSSTQYRCASDKGSVEKRTASGTCTGDGKTCDAKAPVWSSWAKVTTCASGTVCTVGSDGSPGCAKDPGVACGKTDKWETGTKFSTSVKLGSYTDASPAMILSPKVHLNSATDRDYFTYHISDTSALYQPHVRLEWDAPGAVRVCAFYRCDKAADGKSCAPVVCPKNSLSFKATGISGGVPNGCCTTLAKGLMDFDPTVAGSKDISGDTFFFVENRAPFCQETNLKIGFGFQVQTACDPKAACCDATGNFVKKGSKCGASALQTAYRCSSLSAGGDVQMRQSFGGCTGSASTCSTASTDRVWTAWKTVKNCSSTELCVVTDPTKAGSCVASNDALCKASDKWEGPSKTADSINLGSFVDTSDATMVNPMVHLGLNDVDYFKYRIVDNLNSVDPMVDVSWTAAADVTVCAYYQCLAGAGGKECAPVTCPQGAVAYNNIAVSGVKPNGCCMSGKSGQLKWEPDNPGLLNIDETGWVFVNVKNNKAPICQRVNVKLSFAGSKQVCGDGICEGGEATSCPTDCGTCKAQCGAKYDSKKACQCDSFCAANNDCCWDKPLICGG